MECSIPSKRAGYHYCEDDCLDALQDWVGQPQVALLMSSNRRAHSGAWAMKKAIRRLSIGSVLALSTVMPTSAQQTADQSVIYLNQAWSQEDREWYYNFSQGAAI